MAQDYTEYPLHMERFFWALVIMDFCYPLLVAIETRALRTYPPERFLYRLSNKVAIYLHIISGSVIIFGGSAFVIIRHREGSAAVDDGQYDDAYRIIAAFSLLHSLTALSLIATVHGEKAITQPLYYGMILINITDAVTLLRDPTHNHLMLLYGATNAFIFVRFFLFSLVLYPWIDQSTLYTYAVTASFISPVLSGHDAAWFAIYALPAFYAPFVALFGYRTNALTLLKKLNPQKAQEIEVVKDKHGRERYRPSMIVSEPYVLSDEERRRSDESGDVELPGGISSPKPDASKGSFVYDLDSHAWVPDAKKPPLSAAAGGNGPRKDTRVMFEAGGRPGDDGAETPRPSTSRRTSRRKSMAATVRKSLARYDVPYVKPLTGHPFLITNAVRVPSHTSMHTLLIGSVLAAAIVAIIQTQAPVLDDPTTELKFCDFLFNEGLPDFLSIPTDAATSSNPITRQLADVRKIETEGSQLGYQYNPRMAFPYPDGETPVPTWGGYGGPIGALEETMETIYANIREFGPHTAIFVGPELQASLASLATTSPFASSLEDYENAYAEGGFPRPEGNPGYAATNDEVFGFEQGTITSQYIRRVESLAGTRFAAVTDEDLGGILPQGVALADALARGLVYESSYDFIDEINSAAVFEAPLVFGRSQDGVAPPSNGSFVQYIYSTVGLFMNIDGKLMPLAVWVGGDSDLVFYPTDGEADWTFAKMAHTHAAKFISHIVHFPRCHLLIEPIVLAGKRQLSRVHPVRVFVEHHGKLPAGINKFIEVLFFDVPTPLQAVTPNDPRAILGLNGTSIQRLFQRDVADYDFERSDPLFDWTARGLNEMPRFYFREDSIKIISALEDLTAALVNSYYADDSSVERDTELQAWADEIGNMSQGRVRGFPAAIRTRDQLQKLLARLAWQFAVYHAGVSGDNAYEFLSHPLDWVAAFYGPAPAAKGDLDMDALLTMLPTVEQEVYKMSVVRNFRRFFPPADSFALSYLSVGLGTKMLAPIAQFVGRMSDISNEVQARLEHHLAAELPGRSYGLDPATFPFWQWT